MHMFARAAAMAAGASVPPLPFRASATSGAGTAIAKPAGVAVGDVVFITAARIAGGTTVSTATGSTWSSSLLTPSDTVGLFWKIMNATDVAQAWSSSGAFEGALAVAYTPAVAASAVTLRSSTNNAAGKSTLDLAGFGPGPTSRGVVTAIIDRDAGASTEVAPAGFTTRASFLMGSFYKAFVADLGPPGRVTPTVTWTATDGGGSLFAECGWLLEIT